MIDSMSKSQESHAPSAESSKQPPPIPPIPPLLNSPSPFASPPPPLNLESSAKMTDGRHILKPVAPSKRPVTDNATQNDKDKFEIQNAFLPKKLVEIFDIRQRRERAWHARLMICTSVISNIESTLSNFKDEIEKEEASAFRAYLQLAIANFAAVDTTPTPPKIPTHSRPNKSSVYRLGTDKTAVKKVALATPRNILSVDSSERKAQDMFSLPKIPQTVENTWATVARKGKKKAKITLSTIAQVAPARKITPSVTNKAKSSTKVSSTIVITDKRLFVRLPQEHEWRKLSPAGSLEVIVKKLAISPALFGRIKPVHSGFALSPCSTESRETILNVGNRLFLSEAKLEAATDWIPVIVPTVPSTIRKEQGGVEVSKLMLTDEVERVCSIRPAYVKLYGGNKTEAPHRTWTAVFDESGIVRHFKNQQPLECCKRCNGHDPAKNCSRAPSCGNCGSKNHSKNLCMAATKCRNCGGPHRSDSRRCLARPTRSGAPTKEQMKTYGQAGVIEYQAVLRAKTAEESATTAERANTDPTSSQNSEVDDNIDNTPTSPVDISIGDAMRLYWATKMAHPFFDLYLPFGGENVRLRSAAYVRKDPNRTHSFQKYPPSPIGDYCWVEVNGIMFLNVYKASHDPSAVQPLLNWTSTSRTVAMGDFNSVYWAWKPNASSYYGQGEDIDKWAEKHHLTCLIIGEPTHRAGNTLDLAWTNIKETMAWVGTEECMTSDHLPLCGFVPYSKETTESLSTTHEKPIVFKFNLPQFVRKISQ
ncbi:hypothetical protein EPUL_005827 [Erysiphe pulchra]|uniref:Endonuclease/exonuclease/phosphatase domain-containing protein n=1 Tax=Erysiphe pulchra TaxID=225359 RepID=A0A2S4PJK9_9PEZI|nr:hypothetical protein EPUL_005827 [Erysiphe pulchra]